MRGSVLKRLLLLIAAFAFVAATSLPAAVAASGMAPATSCSHCPPQAPAKSDCGKMACGALACAGVAIGLPAPSAGCSAMLAERSYGAVGHRILVGAAPAPDPYPPRPAALD